MTVCCEVALPVPLDRVFTYAVGDGQRPQRGARVVAPFRNEKLIGVVTAVGVAAPADVELRFLEGVLDDEPLLSEQLLALAEWMAQYYLAPLGEVLRGMLPLMAEVRRTVYYRITDVGRDVLAESVEGGDSDVSKARHGAPGVRSSGAEAHDDLDDFMRGLKPPPPSGSSAGAPGVEGVDSHVSKARHGAPGVEGVDSHVSKARHGAPSLARKSSPRRRGKLSPEEQDLEHRVLARLASGEPVKVSTLRTAT